MSAENQQAPLPKREWPTFDDVCKSLEDLLKDVDESKRFPELKLRNRLLNMGLKEFLEPMFIEKEERRRALEARGFPFRYLSQWDEAALAMAYFLSRFRSEKGSKLNVYALHRLSKGEDKTLSDWQTAKAKLYLELQNIILLLDKVEGREAHICRIFAFSKIDDLAFLTQSAVSLLGEQFAMGIKVGFIFTDTFPPERIGTISNNLIIDFHSNSESQTNDPFHFYAMHEILDDAKQNYLPFQEQCAVKWFKNSDEAFSDKTFSFGEAFSPPSLLEQVFHLFPSRGNSWPIPDYVNPSGVYGIEGPEEPSENQIFNSAMVMMAKTFAKYGGAEVADFNKRLNQTVITGDWIRLQRAIRAFDDPASSEIKAVDATSVKNSLSLHESDPTYRQWLRRSLNRVLKVNDETLKLETNKSLKRVYIIDDTEQKAVKEFSTLRREMQYYLDYFHSDISEMESVLGPDAEEIPIEDANPPRNPLEQNLDLFESRVEIFVTTTTILQNIASKTVDAEVLGEIIPGSNTSENLKKVDFISSSTGPRKGMIYDFVNQRADPGELRFDAYLFRDPFNATFEERTLFGIIEDDLDPSQVPYLKPSEVSRIVELRDLQLEYRMSALKESIGKYEKRFGDVLDSIRASSAPNSDNVPAAANFETVSSATNSDPIVHKRNLDKKKRRALLKIRGDIETALYNHFEDRYSYLYNFLEYYSLKVEFFSNRGARLINQLEPFLSCDSVDALTKKIELCLGKKEKPPPVFETSTSAPIAATSSEEVNSKPKIFLSYAHADMERVNELYSALSNAGYDPWQDEKKMVVGEDIKVTIHRALKQADFFMPVLSENSVDREGLVQVEIRDALDIWRQKNSKTVYIVPVRLDDKRPVPDEFENLRYINLEQPEGMKRLLEDLKIIVKRQFK